MNLPGQSVESQEAAIGKALWHQVNTVVILRQNMRQHNQSAEDSMMRTALENMRYKACTPKDIRFSRTRIAGKGPNDPTCSEEVQKCAHHYSKECSEGQN